MLCWFMTYLNAERGGRGQREGGHQGSVLGDVLGDVHWC